MLRTIGRLCAVCLLVVAAALFSATIVQEWPREMKSLLLQGAIFSILGSLLGRSCGRELQEQDDNVVEGLCIGLCWAAGIAAGFFVFAGIIAGNGESGLRAVAALGIWFCAWRVKALYYPKPILEPVTAKPKLVQEEADLLVRAGFVLTDQTPVQPPHKRKLQPHETVSH